MEIKEDAYFLAKGGVFRFLTISDPLLSPVMFPPISLLCVCFLSDNLLSGNFLCDETIVSKFF